MRRKEKPTGGDPLTGEIDLELDRISAQIDDAMSQMTDQSHAIDEAMKKCCPDFDFDIGG